MKVLVLVNTLNAVSADVYNNHIGFFVYTAKKRPDIDIIFFTPPRMSIDMARNIAAKTALQEECDYLMFLDDDVLVPPDALIKLIEADKDIVAGLVIIRGYPFNVMAFKFVDETKKKLDFFNDLEKEYFVEGEWIKSKGEATLIYKGQLTDAETATKRLVSLQECDAVGFSCCLIKCDVLQAVEPPYFVTGPNNTEDVYFCMKATHELADENGVAPKIFLHTGIQCGHMLHPEPIEWHTREKMQAFYKEAAEAQVMKIPVRDATYVNRSLNALGYKGKLELECQPK